MARQPLAGQSLLSIEASRSHSDTPHSVGLLWTSDQPGAETTTYTTHSAHNRQTSMPPRKIRSCDPSSERPKAHALDHAASAIGRYGNAAFKKPVFIESITYILNRGHITFHQTSSQRIHSAPTLNVATQTMIKRRIHVWLERVCSQTQLCQLRCFNDYTILDNYMFQPLLAIFRLSLREIKVLLYILCAHVMERSLHTCLTL